MRAIAINAETKQSLSNLLKQMKSKTKKKIFNNGCSFSTTYVTGGVLKSNNNAIYGSSLSCEVSTARLNGKDYIINNETGKIKAKKPSLRERLLGVSKNTVNIISETINKVKENFENKDVVEQYSCGIEGFTKKGWNRFQEILKGIETQRKIVK